jgi:alkaline phosphatase D
MQTVEGSINMAEFADFSKLQVETSGPLMLIHTPDEDSADKLYEELKGKSPKFEVYRRSETPARWHFNSDPRIGDIVVFAHGPNVLSTRPPGGERKGGGTRGTHGFDTAEFPSMNAIFYATGPNIKPGVVLEPFENVDVFPFVTKILGLKNPPNLDGTEKPLLPALK